LALRFVLRFAFLRLTFFFVFRFAEDFLFRETFFRFAIAVSMSGLTAVEYIQA
jgi:hypothetical protein